MEHDLRRRLLGSIASRRLVILCGAGVSMGQPTSLPSAAKLATAAAAKYETAIGETLPAELHQDLEKLARLLWDQGQLRPLLLGHLIDWTAFQRNPNTSHTSLADFLLCGAIEALISTNYDTQIEDAAYELGERDFLSCVDGCDIQSLALRHKPLLKLHGCYRRDRLNTIWLPEQLEESIISSRVAASRVWLQANLQEKDLLLVGFWTDWSYLNAILETIIQNLNAPTPRMVLLVDPLDADSLRLKAPLLWNWASANDQIYFQHISEPAEDFLDTLRIEVSRQFLRNLLATGRDSFTALTGQPPPAAPDSTDTPDSRGLYDLRRDSTGAAPGEPVRTLETDGLQLLGGIHLWLLAQGAALQGPVFHLDGQSLRVVNGAGQLLGHVRERFESASAPSTSPAVDQVVCVGATPDPTPPNIVRSTSPPTITRPSLTANWLTAQEFISRFVEAPEHGDT